MKKNEILKQHIEALEKLLQLKQAIIEELEAKIERLKSENSQWVPSSPGPFIPPYISQSLDLCPDGTPHNYPAIWGGTQPPCCTKCGKMMYPTNGITISSSHVNTASNSGTPNTTIVGSIPKN